MKILVLIHEYPHVGGGGGKIAKDICEGLAQRGHEIVVVTPHYADLPKVEKRPSDYLSHFLPATLRIQSDLLDKGLFVISSISLKVAIFSKRGSRISFTPILCTGRRGRLLSLPLSGIFIITAHLEMYPVEFLKRQNIF